MSANVDLRDLVDRTRDFVQEIVLPVDDEHGGDIERVGSERIRALQEQAKAAGIFAPHAPIPYGGLGLGMVDRAAVFEEAGYSLLGPAVLNIAAPDEGNMHLLAHVATPTQQGCFLAPLVSGRVRSAFAMTEPSPGAGSDPSALMTRVDGGWRIDGRKWFITGADGAAFHIVMARTSGEPGQAGGATMFLVPAEAEGVSLVRHIPTQDRSMAGGHCEIGYDDVRVTDGHVLGEVDQGFAYAQVRLGPARMTHVMRWLGSARRAHEVAVRHVSQRSAFGSNLAELGMMQAHIADNEIDLAATRALLLQACAELDAGERASATTSMAKTFAAEALCRVADRAVQMCGGLGVSEDLPVARIARELRAFRIYDGASEVHRWSIAKRSVRRITQAPR